MAEKEGTACPVKGQEVTKERRQMAALRIKVRI
jgi:hypothetical protein